MSNKLQLRDLLILFVCGLILSLGVTLFQRVPGYTDAEYYYGGGLRLFEGWGFSEMILWNYLDDPAGLPHPSHAYWMPLPSILAAAGMFLLQNTSYFAARLPFVLLAALVPPLTALVALRLGQGRWTAILAGGLGLFSGFYILYTTLTEGFAIVMVLGSVFLLTAFGLMVAGAAKKLTAWHFLVPGAAAGLIHLTRADGVLWLAAGLAAAWWVARWQYKAPVQKMAAVLGCVLAGYLLVMGPWFVRNQLVFGSMLAPGARRGLWLQEYNQIFAYPAEQLNFAHWQAAGCQVIFRDRLSALGMNLKTAFAVQGQIFLLPLMLAGMWQLRRNRIVVLALGLWLATLGVMSIVFPFAGARGGFFHSGAALQPFLWACVPAGLQAFVDWGSAKRSWDSRTAMVVFGGGLMGLGVLLSGVLFTQRVLGRNWEASWNKSQVLEMALEKAGAGEEDVVVINNPAGMYAATGRAAIVIPDGSLETTLRVAERYGAAWLILEEDHVSGLDVLYETPGDRPGLKYRMTVDGAHMFQITGEE